MSMSRLAVLVVGVLLSFFGASHAAPPAENVVAYAGGQGDDAFHFVHPLSNGDLLVAGSSDSLDWIPSNVKRIELAAGEIKSADPTLIGFVLHVSGDGKTLKHVLHFPKGTVADISRIRSTEVPGAATGALYLSGRRTLAPGQDSKEDGYFIARLNGNFVDRVPSAIEWSVNVNAAPRQASGGKGSSGVKNIQPWDVGADGRVIYGTGAEYDFGWAAIEAVDAAGKPLRVPGWHMEGDRSTIVLKAGRIGSLRSQTQEDFDYRTTDENGNPGRKGRYPDDYYFKSPTEGGPGYSGYRVGKHPTQRLGQIAIDRRNNHLYFGYSTQSRLPGGQPDFEPAIVAMDDQGKLKWWARGYQEIERTPELLNKHQDGLNSPPDQYVDAVAIDYKNDRLVTLLRCHGNGVINFWNGEKLVANPGAKSFQRSFTGKNGNIHIQWLGRYGLDDGKIYNATYVAEIGEGAKVQGKLEGLLEGWHSPNAGWPDVNTTRAVEQLGVGADGSILVLATGRRPITTSNAQVQMLKSGEGVSTWSMFARVYAPDLSTITYSTLLRGPWDPATGKSAGHDVKLAHAALAGDRLVVVGMHEKSKTSDDKDLPTQNVPSWASADYAGATSAVFAILKR